MNLAGLGGLVTVGRDLRIAGMGSLTRLSDLAVLDTVGEDFAVVDNPSLPEQEALDLRDRIGVADIGGTIDTSGNLP